MCLLKKLISKSLYPIIDLKPARTTRGLCIRKNRVYLVKENKETKDLGGRKETIIEDKIESERIYFSKTDCLISTISESDTSNFYSSGDKQL